MFDIKISKLEKSEHNNDGSFLQTPFWCEFKENHGWLYNRFFVDVKFSEEYIKSQKKEDCNHNVFNDDKFQKSFELAVLNRAFFKGKFSIAYIPLMPSLLFECTKEEIIEKALSDENSENTFLQEFITPETQSIEFAHFLCELAKALKSFLPKNTFFIRYDPDVSFLDLEDKSLFNYGLKLISFSDKLKLKKSKVDIQPPDTTLVDLTLSEDEILSKMHSKWRYNIRLSAKKGVKITRYLGNDINLSKKIDKFYELTKETNARDGNSSHSKSYYYDLIKTSAEKLSNNEDVPVVSLYIAEHEGDEIAAIITLFSKTESIYLYGASSNKKRNLMPNHLLQWTAIQDAKVYGSLYYDMYGMPPEGKNESHPMHGLYMFKANFGGKNIHRTGSWDVPLKFIYYFYSFAEKIRAWWFKKFVKKLKGR